MAFRQSRLVVTGLLTALLFLSLSTSVQAKGALFTQKILPLNCVFQTVDDGLGTLYFFTPAECGEIIYPPPETKPAEPTITEPIPPTNSGTNISGGAPSFLTTTDLGLLSDLYTKNQTDITLQAKEGQTFKFAIFNNDKLDAKLGHVEAHSLVIDKIDLTNPNHATVTVTLRSAPITIVIGEGQTITEDLTGNGLPDIDITAIQISPQSVKLSVKVYKPLENLAQEAALPSELFKVRSFPISWRLIFVVLAFATIALVLLSKKRRS